MATAPPRLAPIVRALRLGCSAVALAAALAHGPAWAAGPGRARPARGPGRHTTGYATASFERYRRLALKRSLAGRPAPAAPVQG